MIERGVEQEEDGSVFCNKSTMSGMARYYITPYRLKQISFLCDPERQTDRFVLLGITLLFSESKQGRAWVLDCRGIVDSVDQPACLLVHLKVTKQALHSHSLVLDSSAVANQLWCRDQHCYRRDKSQSSQWPLSTFHRSQDLEDQVHPPRQTVWFGVAWQSQDALLQVKLIWFIWLQFKELDGC